MASPPADNSDERVTLVGREGSRREHIGGQHNFLFRWPSAAAISCADVLSNRGLCESPACYTLLVSERSQAGTSREFECDGVIKLLAVYVVAGPRWRSFEFF